MRCACTQVGSSNASSIDALCDLHQREFQRRLANMNPTRDSEVWNAALDAAEAKLVGPNASPIDTWIKQRVSLVRRQ